MDDAETARLLEQFVEAAYGHAVCQSDGLPVKEGWAHFRSLQKAARALRQAGNISALGRLLNHPDPWVVKWAAAFAFEFDPSAAEAACQIIMDGPNTLTQLSVKYMLREWREGTFTSPDGVPIPFRG